MLTLRYNRNQPALRRTGSAKVPSAGPCRHATWRCAMKAISDSAAFVAATAGHYRQRLLETPLLRGWLIVGPIVALVIRGPLGLALSVGNLALIAIYAVLIRAFTLHPGEPPCIRRPWTELSLVLALTLLLLCVQLLDFGLWHLQPWQRWVSGFFAAISGGVQASGVPGWLRQDAFLAISSTLKQTLPAILLLAAIGGTRNARALAKPYWRLTGALIGLTAVFGLASGVLLRLPLYQTLALYLVGMLINALPEELLVRGMLLPRLERALANPLNALVVSALLFNALHVPIAVLQGASPLEAIAGVFSLAYPSGLIWGYLYLCTRSIVPGVLWHAANMNLGFVLLDL